MTRTCNGVQEAIIAHDGELMGTRPRAENVTQGADVCANPNGVSEARKEVTCLGSSSFSRTDEYQLSALIVLR